MGRSVSQHKNAVETVFIHLELDEEDNHEQFQDFVSNVREVLTEKYPSLTKADRWSGREDHIILENSQVEISVSEYCGLVAVCLAPLNSYDNEAFNQAVAGRMAKSFDKYLTKAFKPSVLKSLGHASNGEQFFTKV